MAMTGGGDGAAQHGFEGCRWLHDPGTPFGDADRWPQDARENLHVAFRATFDTAESDDRVRLTITADDLFKVWIDGALLGAGPAPCGPAPCFVNGFELWLRPGRHVIAVQVYYHGPRARMHTSGDGFTGLIARLQACTSGRDLCRTDAAWRCRRLTSRTSGGRMYGYTTQFAEDIDLRAEEPGWRAVDFDDAHWDRAAAIDVPAVYRFQPQVAAPVAYSRAEPVRIANKGGGRFLLDFGHEIVGETCFAVAGEAGHRVEVRHAEELSAPDEARFEMRAGCKYQEWVTLSGRRPDVAEFFDYKGFRYVELLNWPEADVAGKVWVQRREAPWPADASTFESDAPHVDAIWRLCAHAVRVGTQERYLDCPTREKIAFLGDALVTGHAHLLLTADPRPYRQLWEDFKLNYDDTPLIGCHGNRPGSEILVEYSLLIPEMLLTYHQLTGDREPLTDWAPRVRGMLDAYGRCRDADGLIADVHLAKPAPRVARPLVDWPDNLRDGYDDPTLLGRKLAGSERGIANAVVNARHAAAWRDYAAVLRTIGQNEAAAEAERAWRDDRARVRAALRGSDGLFVDRRGSTHASFHANVAALDAGIAEVDEVAAIVDLVRQKGLACGVWFAHFILRALARHGHADLAYDLLANASPRGWREMLAHGATACLEAWGPDQKWNTSWCHPWASAPLPFLVEHVMGVRFREPGKPTVGEPTVRPAELGRARLRLRSAAGVIEVRL